MFLNIRWIPQLSVRNEYVYISNTVTLYIVKVMPAGLHTYRIQAANQRIMLQQLSYYNLQLKIVPNDVYHKPLIIRSVRLKRPRSLRHCFYIYYIGFLLG